MPSLWTPPKPDVEPRKVLIKKDKLIDTSRDNRPVPIKIYYPECTGAEKFPVIVWSHGLGGTADGAAYLSRFLAAQGYVLLHVQHHGTDSSLWEGKPGHPWDVIRNAVIPRADTIARFQDVPFVLDAIGDWLLAHPEIAACADFENLGMSGHSFGALTTQVMAGQRFPDESGALKEFGDARFKAGILYSPVPVFHLTDAPAEQVYGSINLPLLHMTGTEDASPVEGWDYTRRLVIHEHAKAVEQYLHILEEGDHMVYAGSRGKLGDNPNREAHEAAIKQTALAFWEAYLKRDDGAKAWLRATLSQS